MPAYVCTTDMCTSNARSAKRLLSAGGQLVRMYQVVWMLSGDLLCQEPCFVFEHFQLSSAGAPAFP